MLCGLSVSEEAGGGNGRARSSDVAGRHRVLGLLDVRGGIFLGSSHGGSH